MDSITQFSLPSHLRSGLTCDAHPTCLFRNGTPPLGHTFPTSSCRHALLDYRNPSLQQQHAAQRTPSGIFPTNRAAADSLSDSRPRSLGFGPWPPVSANLSWALSQTKQLMRHTSTITSTSAHSTHFAHIRPSIHTGPVHSIAANHTPTLSGYRSCAVPCFTRVGNMPRVSRGWPNLSTHHGLL